MNLAQNVCLNNFLCQVQNLVTWSQKLSHQAKLKENIVNTPEITFYVIIMNLPQNICLDDFKVKFGTGPLMSFSV